ncbi:MAG: hypothetical protein ABJQ34_15430 [Paracoccaceae bacterium]
MLRLVFTFFLILFGPMANANQNGDANFFITYFVDDTIWDRAYRAMKLRSPLFYRNALLERDVTIADRERFIELMPEDATKEAVQLIKSRAVELISEQYGAENLAEIAEFFRTTTGKKMLNIARDEKLFKGLESLYSPGAIYHPMKQWSKHLSILEIARFNAFTNSPAGQVFIRDTVAIKKSVFIQIRSPTRWPKPPLNRPYIVNIMTTDNVLKFPNRIARQSLIRELSISSP